MFIAISIILLAAMMRGTVAVVGIILSSAALNAVLSLREAPPHHIVANAAATDLLSAQVKSKHVSCSWAKTRHYQMCAHHGMTFGNCLATSWHIWNRCVVACAATLLHFHAADHVYKQR